MPPPNNAKGAPARRRLSESDTQQGADRTKSQSNRRSRQSHAFGQLPIVRSATVWPPATGNKTAPIMLDQPCECGDWHAHRSKWPAPALASKSARCGAKYELALHAPKVAKRGRRAA